MRFRRTIASVVLGVACLVHSGGAAAGETIVRGLYEVSLAGLPVGQGGWDVRLGAQHFQVTGWGKTAGFLRLFWSGKGEASASGDMRDGRPEPRRYDYESTTKSKFDEIRLRIDGGAVTEWLADPPQKPRKSRVPLRDEDRIGIVDPIAAILMAVPGQDDVISAHSCARVLPVFDGRMRYDLRFSFQRVEIIKHDSGYHGPVAVCGVQFVPIAGHVPERKAISYLTQLKSMEIWLVPVSGTRLVVPLMVSIPTPFGIAMLRAERFEVGLE